MEAQKILERLSSLLSIDDTTANRLFSESEALLKNTFGSRVEQFGQQIAAFDYPAALAILKSISNSPALIQKRQPAKGTDQDAR
ncbi:hypothetical protein QQ73_05750 [Candidatus Endoriftia persephone str. Guaymas]|nr:hypothetical protein [Candidatus Endoriftia persephone str. Guaymas]